MAKTPEEITVEYRKYLIARATMIENQVLAMYLDLINQIAPLAAAQSLPPGVFSLQKLQVLNNRIDQLLTQLNQGFEVIVKSGINDAWQLSNQKNDVFADIRLDKSIIPAEKQLIYYDTNAAALEAYTNSTINGLTLSDRIYKTGEVLRSELETGLAIGISEGASAAQLGRDLRQYLKEPDKLFRRVKDSEGNLQLSQNAKNFHPGQGVYRSSRANIERLTRTTINDAYRQADNSRWQNMPFVLGQEIHVSGSHPKYDICDEMEGDYPIEFVFIGWHPQCICFTVPKLMNDQQFKAYQALVLAGNDTPANVGKIARPVVDLPDSANKWMNDNAERIAGWKNPPLWWDKNANYVPDLPKQ